MARIIDTEHGGLGGTIGAWVTDDDVIIDPGPASTAAHVIAELGHGFEPRAILLTHIHLDHAAGTGSLVARFPSTPVYVHEGGAPHIIDPARLLKSAARLYGEENMLPLWGEVLPVPAERVTALSGGERVQGLEVIHTPGHAGSYVVYLSDDGSAFVGDVAGVRTPPGDLTVMPTPPPEIDVELWLDSIARLAEREPECLRLTHFGEIPEAAEQLAAAAESLRLTAGWAEAGDEDAFVRSLQELSDTQPPLAAERMRSAMPPDQVMSGLIRYWRKRREAEASG
jgi:glyoxylase-like metal-dependent hydrolase (beta-lactamase superfamily II)